MKIINAFDGRQYQVGDYFDTPSRQGQLLEIEDSFFSARARVQYQDGVRWVPLIIRFMHPKHLFQRVAFIPT